MGQHDRQGAPDGPGTTLHGSVLGPRESRAGDLIFEAGQTHLFDLFERCGALSFQSIMFHRVRLAFWAVAESHTCATYAVLSSSCLPLMPVRPSCTKGRCHAYARPRDGGVA
jgi:hypothetical protein